MSSLYHYAYGSSYVAENEPIGYDSEVPGPVPALQQADLHQMHDWNGRFQSAVKTYSSEGSKKDDTEQYENVYKELYNLSQDFVYAAETYGRIIISELYLPDNEKTIKPVMIGGVAGGVKYVVQKILFKLAVDKHKLFNSPYEAAAKVAKHDLKGLINMFNDGIKQGLCFPMTSLIDYRGFRIIAMSILPIDNTTLKYGSSDGGVTVHCSDELLKEKVSSVCKDLNLQVHRVSMDEKISVYSPADLEGHQGKDGRYYLLDFSRLFPPEKPIQGVRNAYLFRLLRPELVRKHPKALNSDAFSKFSQNDPNIAEHNAEIEQATDNLINNVIPAFANRLIEDTRNLDSDMPLVNRIHRFGINVRYLGLVRKHLLQHNVGKDKSFEKTKDRWHMELLVEMIARALKCTIHDKLRKKHEALKMTAEQPYKAEIVQVLNFIFGNTDAATEYWKTTLKESVCQKFVGEDWSSLGSDPKKYVTTYRVEELLAGNLLLKRVCKLVGLKVNKGRLNLTYLFQLPSPFAESDIKRMDSVVHHMHIMSFAHGQMLKLKARQLRTLSQAEFRSYCKQALKKFYEALHGWHNPQVKRNLGQIYAHLAAEKDETGVYETKAREYLLKAIQEDPYDATSHFQYAILCHRNKKFDIAEHYYINALKLDPNYLFVFSSYCLMLGQNNLDKSTALKLFEELKDRENCKLKHEYQNWITNEMQKRSSTVKKK